MPKIAAILSLILSSACAHTMIEGTEIPDTEENRAVLATIVALRDALQKRDANAVISLVSPKYFEDMGTPDPKDDYGYDQLKTDVLPKSMAVTREFYVSFEVEEIVVQGDAAHADLRYDSRARLDLPAGTLWDSHKEFNRIILAREDGSWRIVSGL